MTATVPAASAVPRRPAPGTGAATRRRCGHRRCGTRPAPASRPVPGRRLLRDETGAGMAETVIVTPLLLLLLLAVIQFALAEHGQHVAQAAATQALAAARVQDGSASAGQAQAAAVLAQLGHSLNAPTVSVSRTATQATVTVTGGVETLIPGLHLIVHATVTGPVERWAP
jgi:Flp pilus assembly protein TadG